MKSPKSQPPIYKNKKKREKSDCLLPKQRNKKKHSTHNWWRFTEATTGIDEQAYHTQSHQALISFPEGTTMIGRALSLFRLVSSSCTNLRATASWLLGSLTIACCSVWLVYFDCLRLDYRQISSALRFYLVTTLSSYRGKKNSKQNRIGNEKWKSKYLRLRISVCKPLLNVSGNWKENLLDIQVCLCTLQNRRICFFKLKY